METCMTTELGVDQSAQEQTTATESLTMSCLQTATSAEEEKVAAGMLTGVCSNPTCDLESKPVMLCGKCRVAQYCSKQCQQQHWSNGQKFATGGSAVTAETYNHKEQCKHLWAEFSSLLPGVRIEMFKEEKALIESPLLASEFRITESEKKGEIDILALHKPKQGLAQYLRSVQSAKGCGVQMDGCMFVHTMGALQKVGNKEQDVTAYYYAIGSSPTCAILTGTTCTSKHGSVQGALCLCVSDLELKAWMDKTPGMLHRSLQLWRSSKSAGCLGLTSRGLQFLPVQQWFMYYEHAAKENAERLYKDARSSHIVPVYERTLRSLIYTSMEVEEEENNGHLKLRVFGVDPFALETPVLHTWPESSL